MYQTTWFIGNIFIDMLVNFLIIILHVYVYL